MKRISNSGVKACIQKFKNTGANKISIMATEKTKKFEIPDCRIFSEDRAKELLAYEKELKSMRKVAIENYRSVK